MGKLLERLGEGTVICAEGYLFEFERRGYLQAGAFVPEVVLEEPALVAQLHREFVHAGSDVVEAFTYYAHREKLALIGREGDLEAMNRQRVADRRRGRRGARLAGRRQHLQHEHLRARRRRVATPRPRHVRRAGRLGCRGGRRPRDRRDVLVRAGGAGRARRRSRKQVSMRSSRWPSTATPRHARAGPSARRAGASRTPAPTWSG